MGEQAKRDSKATRTLNCKVTRTEIGNEFIDVTKGSRSSNELRRGNRDEEEAEGSRRPRKLALAANKERWLLAQLAQQLRSRTVSSDCKESHLTVAFSMRSGEVRADAVDLKTAHKQVVRVARVDTSEDEAQEAVRRLGVRDRPRSARSQRIERRIIDVSAQRDPIGVVGRTLQLPIARVVAGVVAARAKRVVGRANRVGCAKIELQAKSVTETRD